MGAETVPKPFAIVLIPKLHPYILYTPATLKREIKTVGEYTVLRTIDSDKILNLENICLERK